MGEKLFRLIEGARRPSTKKEKDYLNDIFNDVYTEARNKCRYSRLKADLYITDKMYINAFALGGNTVCLTKGAVLTLTADELKGVIAHELGHISNGDTRAVIVNVVGNGIFAILVMIARFTISVMNFFDSDKMSLISLIMTSMRLMLDGFYFVVMFVGQAVLSINNRESEYRADEYAYRIGYGDELLKALYTLQDIELPSNVRLFDRLRANHPYLAYRIERLENLLEEE